MPKKNRKRKQVGAVYLVGAGPGDPQLMTIRGQRLLARADAVVIDRLVSRDVLGVCRSDVVIFDVGKAAGGQGASQGSINRLLIRLAKNGRRVVRLKGGDPLLFGRGAEEALALASACIPFEIVPGVTSALAAPAAAGIPLTHRAFASTVGILTGHEDPRKGGGLIQWTALVRGCDTLVCLMAVQTLPALTQRLIGSGRGADTPAAVIERGTWPAQRTVTATLGDIAQKAQAAQIQPPAILVVGEVVRLREHLSWFEHRPLWGTRILVTRAAEKSNLLAECLQDLGAEVERLPAIELAPMPRAARFTQVVQRLPQTDWVCFTSPEGIAWLAYTLRLYRKDLRSLAGCHIAAIGIKTAESIEARGLHVDFVPKRFSQEGVLDDWPKGRRRGKRAMIFCAEQSRDVLADGLRERGLSVEKVPIYRTRVPASLPAAVKRVFERPMDYVTVTSASCVEHLYRSLAAAGLGRQFRALAFASIGPVTSETVRRHGGNVAVEARESTIEDLAATLAAKHAEAAQRTAPRESFESFSLAVREEGE